MGLMNESVPVLRPINAETRQSVQREEIKLRRFPFRVGRECRVQVVDGRIQRVERRKGMKAPNNDLYMIDEGELLNISREHFQVESDGNGAFQLVDRESTCGTLVNDHKVGGRNQGGRCPLTNGDVIVVGGTDSPYRFKFIAAGSGA